MNIHHLELFYYVAKHGGIASAVRKMPYGIQQPAVSGQIAKLEETLGTKLFERRPFALSPAGLQLFEFIRPFFEDIGKIADTIRGEGAPQLRIAAPAIVLHDYVPDLLQRLRKRFPVFRLSLHEAARGETERLLQAREIDLAITVLEQKRATGIQWRALIELPLVLLVNREQKLSDAGELWARDKIEETLITFPRGDAVLGHFQSGLQRLGVEWFPGIEVNSARLIERYVVEGHGIGLSVGTPEFQPSKAIRVLPLPNFPRIVIGAAWTGKMSTIAQHFLAELEDEAKGLRSRKGSQSGNWRLS